MRKGGKHDSTPTEIIRIAKTALRRIVRRRGSDPVLDDLQNTRKQADKRISISYHHGARDILATYATVPPDEINIPGYWMHGWLPRYYQLHPLIVALHKKEGRSHHQTPAAIEDEKRTIWQWVARQDEADYLAGHGYTKVAPIGLPFAYLPEVNVERVPGSLLVMPPHGRKAFSDGDPFAESYADAIADIRANFSDVFVSITEGDYFRGEWRFAFERRGIPVLIGSNPFEPDPLLKVKRMLSQFEYVTTNAFGSHIAYAAATGAKVSVFGPYAEWRPGNLKPFAAKMMPELLAVIREACSEKLLRQYCPFLFTNPNCASKRVEWASFEIGTQHRLTPEEIRSRFITHAPTNGGGDGPT